MKINVNEWEEFKISNLFEVVGSKTTSKDTLEEIGAGEFPYITTSAQNNGVEGYYNYWTEKGNVITVESACMGFSTYQAKEFSASDHVELLKPKFELNAKIGLFLVCLINNENFKFSYGRKCNQTKIKNMILRLPICRDEDGQPVIDNTYKYSEKGYVPDFKWIEEYIKTLNYQPLTTSNGGAKLKFSSLGVDKWKEFKIGSFFEIKRGKRLTEEDREKGNLEYYSASEFNNGLTDRISNPLFIEENALIYTTFGDCYYVPNKFTASDEISIWKYKGVDVYNALFIATIVNKNKYKYAYGRKAFKNKYEDEIIKLPICYESDGITPIKDRDCVYSTEGYVPDFDLMKKYILQLPYGDRLIGKTDRQTDRFNLAVIPHLENDLFWIEIKYVLRQDTWKDFKLGKFFTLENGQKYPSDIRESGNLPLVSTSAENNGVSDYIAPRADHVHSNFLTVAYSGSVGATFYHKDNVFVGETVFALLPKIEFNQYIGEFFATVMNFENYRYSYGRKIIGSKYGDSLLKLPICFEDDGITPMIDKTCKYSEEGYVPNFQFMENYIKSLPYGDRL